MTFLLNGARILQLAHNPGCAHCHTICKWCEARIVVGRCTPINILRINEAMPAHSQYRAIRLGRARTHRLRGRCDVFARVWVMHTGTGTGWVTLISERSGNSNGRPSNQGRTARHRRQPYVDAVCSPGRCRDPGVLPPAEGWRGASCPADGCERIRRRSRAVEGSAHQPVESPGLERAGFGDDVVDPRQWTVLSVSAHHRARAFLPGSGRYPVV